MSHFSSIRDLNALVRSIEGAINLTIGVPHFPPAPQIMAEASDTLIRTGYPPLGGLPLARREVATALGVAGDQVLITSGSSAGFFISLLHLLDRPGEVILPSPYYPGYLGPLKDLGIPYRTVDTSLQGFSFDTKLLEAIKTPVRALILNSPNNPTGAVIGEKDLELLVEWCRKHDAYLIFDETYKDYDYLNKFARPRYEKAIIVGSFSKSLFIPGYRLGYLIASQHLLPRLAVIWQNLAVGTALPLQHALTRVNDPSVIAYTKEAIEYYKHNREMVAETLAELHLSYINPDGAFYFFVKLPDLDCISFCSELLNNYQVGVVPGTIFGDYHNYFRMSTALSREDLKVALTRIKHFFS